MELAIDTSTRYASVAVADCGAVVVEQTWRSGRNHSVELAPAVRRIMALAGAKMDGLTAIYVASGPGGFSALRVGMSTAKAMSAVVGAPLVAVPTLDVEAEPYLGLGMPVHAVMMAGKTRRYIGRFSEGGRPEYSVVEDDDLATHVTEKTLFCGEGLAEVKEILTARLGSRAVFARGAPPTRRPGSLAEIAHERLQRGDTADVESLQPLYLRSAQVETAQRAWPS